MTLPKKKLGNGLKMIASVSFVENGSKTICDIWLIDSYYRVVSAEDLYCQLQSCQHENSLFNPYNQNICDQENIENVQEGSNSLSHLTLQNCYDDEDEDQTCVSSNRMNTATLPQLHNRILSRVKNTPSISEFYDMSVNAIVAACLIQTLKLSSVFCSGFIRYTRRKILRLEKLRKTKNDCLILEMQLQWPEKIPIDFAWCYRVTDMVVQRLILDEAMAWLSTLGGAYSALGEYFQFHAQQAGNVSMKQLKVALKVGDPISIAKCKVFYAQSLVQQGHWKLAKKIIRVQYQFAITMGRRDKILVSMCHALWGKLQYLKRQRKSTNSQIDPER
ncbi:uncharacterized protein LOC106165941 [Lingula anatina]|uniref:Uncharacterized protein LOC106165941 n=1 Tax=Lingula anatina TaxID=7574 RepID=A0A1S3IQE3_LINAN|nr:uncharacterized protein LOC106165941 [Lingula anatina]XP_013399759.1 uncharacterized protein LOC106165941 [Lingula anatina]|eukprot:XP_013399758.1 uncharacterized protein LOC106165941 [Lingula anatina]